MLAKLPYRVQIPLGLSVAVVIAALLVTVVSARISARVARQDTLATVDRAVALLHSFWFSAAIESFSRASGPRRAGARPDWDSTVD